MKAKTGVKSFRWVYWTAMVVMLLTFCRSASAAENNPANGPWEKAGANLGVFLSSINSSFRIGSGVGLELDVEKLLDLDSTSTVFRADAFWRFSGNRRHRLDLSWFAFRRDGSRQVGEDIVFEDDDGNQTVIEAGSLVEANFDLDIFELAYSYSFFQDERIDLAAGIGLYVMPIDFGLASSGAFEVEGAPTCCRPSRRPVPPLCSCS